MARARTIVAAVAVLAGGVAFASSYDLSRDDVKVTVETQPDAVDPGRDFFVTLTLSAPAGQSVELPDLRTRFQGFQVAEDFTEDPLKAADGSTTLVSRWRLVPEPMARKYRLAPFVINNFYTSPVLFEPPPKRTKSWAMASMTPACRIPSMTMNRPVSSRSVL